MFRISIIILFVIKFVLIVSNAIFEPRATLFVLFDFLVGVGLIANVGFYVFKKPHKEIEGVKKVEVYFDELYKALFSLIVILGVSAPLNRAFASMNLSELQSIFHALVALLISVISIYSAFIFLKYLYERSIEQIHRKTKRLNKSIKVIAVVLFVGEIFFGEASGDNIPLNLMTFVLGILAFINSKQSLWLFSISAKNKWKIIFYSISGLILCSIVFGLSSSSEMALCKSLHLLARGSEILLVGISSIGLGYFARLLLSAVKSLPNSKILARKSSEVESLAYLNRLVAETIEPERVMEDAAKLALQFNENSPVWVELYTGGATKIAAFQKINLSDLEQICSINILRNFILSTVETCLVPSIHDNARLKEIGSEIDKFFNSMVILPLFSANTRTGSIIITHTKGYGFEKDNINALSAFGYNVGTAIENARLLKESVEKERYKKELLIAKDIQTKLLPQILPNFENYALDVFADTADEVGGDYYDALRLGNGKLALLIGDVSGKGIGAAFYMAKLNGAALSASKEVSSASEFLAKINNALYGAMEKQMYITLSCITLDYEGNVEYARAGHTAAILKSGDKMKELKPKGLGIGLASAKFFNANLEQMEFQLADGETILLYTDGVNEARNANCDEFGFERILEALAQIKINNPINELKNALKSFVGDAPLHDDTTIMSIQYKIN